MADFRFGLDLFTRKYNAAEELKACLSGSDKASTRVGRKFFSGRTVAPVLGGSPNPGVVPLVEVGFDRAERLAWYLAVGWRLDPDAERSPPGADALIRQYVSVE